MHSLPAPYDGLLAQGGFPTISHYVLEAIEPLKPGVMLLFMHSQLLYVYSRMSMVLTLFLSMMQTHIACILFTSRYIAGARHAGS